MIRFKLIKRDECGAAAIEMAFALPILMIMLYGIFQLGVILQANAGMQHALGEGARLATLCQSPTATACTTPSDTTIQTKMANAVFGMNVGTFDAPTVTTPPTADCTNCRLLTVTYRVTPNFLFFTLPQVTLTRTKRVYLAAM